MAVRKVLMALGLAAAALAAASAHAQSGESEIDRLIDQSGDPRAAMALARRLIGEDDLVGAAATLERVLIGNPYDDAALLLHASLLCRLDDKAGARAELASLSGVAANGAGWAEVTAACGPVPRPGGR